MRSFARVAGATLEARVSRNMGLQRAGRWKRGATANCLLIKFLVIVIVIVVTVEIINFGIDIKASAIPRSNHFLCSDKPAHWNYTNALHRTSRKRSQRCRSSADKLESTAREERAHNVCARVLNFFQIARCDGEAGLVPAGCRQGNKRRFANADTASPELHASE